MYAKLHQDLSEFCERNDWKSFIENMTDDFTFKSSRAGLTFDRDELFTIIGNQTQLHRHEFKLHRIVEIDSYALGIGDADFFNDKIHKEIYTKEYVLLR